MALCAPLPPPGFLVCVAALGDDACPTSTYLEKHLAFDGVDDMRSCSACTCGAPSGGKCTATIAIYADEACASAATYAETIDSTMPEWCADVTTGPLLSKSAGPPIFVPGSCTPAGGQAGGDATPTSPMTFCCMKVLDNPPLIVE